jgi:hypothetical protein
MKEDATRREAKENARELEAERTRAALLAMRDRCDNSKLINVCVPLS